MPNAIVLLNANPVLCGPLLYFIAIGVFVGADLAPLSRASIEILLLVKFVIFRMELLLNLLDVCGASVLVVHFLLYDLSPCVHV